MTAIGPGSRVKCVSSEAWEGRRAWWQFWKPVWSDDTGPALGTVWTVDDVGELGGDVYLGLFEWPEPNACFQADAFVPLEDDSVDLSALTAALNKGPLEPERDERVRVVERVR